MEAPRAIRLEAVRSYNVSAAKKKGTLYVSAMNATKRWVFIGWDPKPGVASQGITLEMSAEEAIKLMEFIQGLYACEICGAAAPTKDGILHRDELCFK